MPNPPLFASCNPRSLWSPLLLPFQIIRNSTTKYAHSNEPITSVKGSMYDVELLDVGAIWKAVRSGVWYPCGWEDVETANRLVDDSGIARVQDTMSFVVERLSKLERNPDMSMADDIVLADFTGKTTQTHIRHCSTRELRCVLAALQSLSSPWRKLPDELLIEVFSWCLPSNTVFSTSRAPLLFTEICSRWHTLSVNTPSLWTSLILTENFLINKEAHLHVATDFEERWQRYNFGLGPTRREFMSTILRRSLPHPISISSHSGILLQDDTRQLFYDNFSRFRDLALLVPEPNHGHSAPIPTVDQPLVAPFLETLDIYALRVHGPPIQSKSNWASPYSELILSSSLTLRRLTCCVPSWPKIDFNRRWDKLTHITWSPRISEAHVITLFHSAPNLCYASLPEIAPNYYIPPSAANFQGDPVVMTSLETLVVGARGMGALFTAITAPKLRHLVHLAPSSQDKHALIAFLQRSASLLETLYLYHALYASHTDLLDILENVEGSIGCIAFDEKRAVKRRGHLKALLVTDGNHDRHLLSDSILDRLTWKRPDGSRGAVNPTESNTLTVDQNLANSPLLQEHPHVRTGDDILFPGLEYLSFYDIGSTSPGKLPEMLRSRAAKMASPVEHCTTNNVNSTSVAKLKVFETWHRDAGLNDVNDVDWDALEALRDDGLVFRLFRSSDVRSTMCEAEKDLLRQYVQEEGLVVRDYLHDIGQLAPIPLDEETNNDSSESLGYK